MWLDDSLSDLDSMEDDEEDEDDRLVTCSKKTKAKVNWGATSSRKQSTYSDNEMDDVRRNNSEVSGDYQEDDADDEDWTAIDTEKHPKRPRPRPPGSYGKAVVSRNQSSDLPHHNKSQTGPARVLSGYATARQPNPKSSRTKSYQSGFASSAANRRQHIRQPPSVSSPAKNVFSHVVADTKQCLGPGCIRPAAGPETKYCSDECGLRLAFRRLEVLLPESLPDLCLPETEEEDIRGPVSPSRYRPTYIANQLDRSRLEEIEIAKGSMRERLLELEMEHQQLTNLLTRAHECRSERMEEQLFLEATRDVDQMVEQMEPIVCVTCASEVSMRHALRHMEKCFQKMEGKTSFCANQKEQIMGTPLFCDTYDVQAKAYCKRLRVVCEHYKEPKLPSDTLCGFPLVRNVFEETGQFCNITRSKCTRHLGWERLRRAYIDIERYRCFIRMDDLQQEELRVQHAMSQRGGLLGVLLHRTVDHTSSLPAPSIVARTKQSADTVDTT